MKKYDFFDIIQWAKHNKKGTPPAELLLPLYKYKMKHKGVNGYGYIPISRKIGITKSRFEFWIGCAIRLLDGRPKRHTIVTDDTKFIKDRWDKKLTRATEMMLTRRGQVKEIQHHNRQHNISPTSASLIALNLMDNRISNAKMPKLQSYNKRKSHSYDLDGKSELGFLGGKRL